MTNSLLANENLSAVFVVSAVAAAVAVSTIVAALVVAVIVV